MYEDSPMSEEEILEHFPESTKEKEIEILQMQNDKAFISNVLLKSMFLKKGTFTAIQILMWIASIDDTKTIKKGHYYHIEINVTDFMKIHNTKKVTLYKHLNDIQCTIIKVLNPNRLWSKISLIAKQEKITRDIIKIDMHEKIYSMIKEKKGNFSVLKASNFQNNISFNSLRVLLLLGLIDNQDSKSKQFTLKQLNFLFDTNYKKLYEFDRQIFQKAKRELDDNSNLTLTTKRIETMALAKGRPITVAIKVYAEKGNHFQAKMFK